MAQNHKFQRLVVTAFYLKHLKYQLFLPYIQYLHTMGYNLKHQITGRHRKRLYQQGKSIINKTVLVKNKDRKKWGLAILGLH